MIHISAERIGCSECTALSGALISIHIYGESGKINSGKSYVFTRVHVIL